MKHIKKSIDIKETYNKRMYYSLLPFLNEIVYLPFLSLVTVRPFPLSLPPIFDPIFGNKQVMSMHFCFWSYLPRFSLEVLYYARICFEISIYLFKEN